MRRALPSARSAPYGAGFAALAAIAMIAIVYLQDGAAYPYEALNQHQLDSIMAKLLRHPAMAESHLALAETAAANADHELHDRELRAAVWLDPNDPAARDRYARDLLIVGDQRAGLDEITRSVYRAPESQAHYYLRPGLIPWLLPDEQAAIADGLEQAVDYQYAGARDTLAAFYRELGRYDDLGQLFEKLAIDETEPSRKISDLVESGSDYARAGRATTAIAKLREATAIDPQDARPYAELARAVYGPNHQMEAAQAIIQEGLRAAADPFQLEIALADASEKADSPRATEDALEAALHARPSFSIAMRLGSFYLDDQRPARAAAAFERAAEIDSGSAEAWFALAQAREREFDYAAAARAYDRAQILEPRSRYYASIYEAFERRMAQGVEDANTRDGPR
jgi:tetratricopeptide (TPR) repeat protein